MSAAAIPLVLAIGELAVQGVQAYQQAKATQAAATVSDQAAIAELDKQLAAAVAGADAADAVLDKDLGIGGTSQQI